MAFLVGLTFFGVALALNRQVARAVGLKVKSHTQDILGISGSMVSTLAVLVAFALKILM